MIDFLKEAETIRDELCSIRHHLHAHPETGRMEYETQAYLEEVLDAWGIGHKRCADTGLLAEVIGEKPGVCRVLRADMDALQVQEETGVSFASVHEGIMHACGHDIHMSAALGALKLLQKHKSGLHGTVRVLFQPDEENNGGAERMMAEGALDGVSAVFGAHTDPLLPLGTVGIRHGKFYAASNPLTIVLHGKSAHGAQPELGINALHAGAELVVALQALPDELHDPSVVTIGTFQAGSAMNVIADTCTLRGIVRTLGPEDRSYMKQRIRACVEQVEEEFGVHAEVAMNDGYPGVVNTEPETSYVEECLHAVLPEAQVVRLEKPLLTTEDVGYLIAETGGCFYHLGVGGAFPLHNPHYLPDDEAAVFGAGVHASVLFGFDSK